MREVMLVAFGLFDYQCERVPVPARRVIYARSLKKWWESLPRSYDEMDQLLSARLVGYPKELLRDQLEIVRGQESEVGFIDATEHIANHYNTTYIGAVEGKHYFADDTVPTRYYAYNPLDNSMVVEHHGVASPPPLVPDDEAPTWTGWVERMAEMPCIGPVATDPAGRIVDTAIYVRDLRTGKVIPDYGEYAPGIWVGDVPDDVKSFSAHLCDYNFRAQLGVQASRWSGDVLPYTIANFGHIYVCRSGRHLRYHDPPFPPYQPDEGWTRLPERWSVRLDRSNPCVSLIKLLRSMAEGLEIYVEPQTGYSSLMRMRGKNKGPRMTQWPCVAGWPKVWGCFSMTHHKYAATVPYAPWDYEGACICSNRYYHYKRQIRVEARMRQPDFLGLPPVGIAAQLNLTTYEMRYFQDLSLGNEPDWHRLLGADGPRFVTRENPQRGLTVPGFVNACVVSCVRRLTASPDATLASLDQIIADIGVERIERLCPRGPVSLRRTNLEKLFLKREIREGGRLDNGMIMTLRGLNWDTERCPITGLPEPTVDWHSTEFGCLRLLRDFDVSAFDQVASDVDLGELLDHMRSYGDDSSSEDAHEYEEND